jgi:Flp pilus assembly protein TadD
VTRIAGVCPTRIGTRVAAVCLGAALAAMPVVGRSAEQWTFASSEHFEVYTTGGDRRARESLAYFERIHAFFEDFMKLSPKQDRPTRLIVFSNRREYTPYRPNEWATAYYLSGPDRDYIVIQSLDAESYPLVVHEYAHLIFKHSGAVYPRWLNEGLAEFFSTISPEGGKMSIGKVTIDRLRMVRTAELLTLDRLFGADLQSPEFQRRDHVGIFYAQSWALVHMIMTEERYRPRSNELLTAIGSGTPAVDAFRSVYGKSLVQVMNDLRGYIRGDHYLFFAANYRDPKIDRGFTTRAADGFEAGLITANLLASHRERQTEARTAYETLAAGRPDDLGLVEARAHFELRQGDRSNAETFVRRAIALGSQNATLYRLAAGSYADSIEEREALLAKAVGFAPGDLDIRLTYASTLLQQRKAAEGLAALAPVSQIPADDAFVLFQLRANLLAQLNRIDEARAAAARARAYANSTQVDYADRLVQSLDAHAARQAEADRLMRDVNRAELEQLAGTTSRPPAPTDTSVFERATQFSDLLTVATGRLRNMVCGIGAPIVEIAVDSGLVRLVIDDPVRVRIEGAGGPTTDLICGAQNRPVRFGYAPGADAARKTAGALRLLDFR